MSRRAAIYARVSTEKQDAENKVSIEMQLADCEAYCRKHGYTIVARHVDNKKYRSRGKMVEPSALAANVLSSRPCSKRPGTAISMSW